MSSSEEMGLVPSQRLENGLNSQLVFQDETLRFNCDAPAPQRRVGDPGPKTRELTGFIDEKMFSSVDRDRFFTSHGAEFRRSIYGGEPPDRRDTCNWNGNGGSTTTPSNGGSEEDDDDDDDEEDEVDEGDGEVEGLVCGDDANKSNTNNNNNSSGSVHSLPTADKIGNGKTKQQSSFGSSREVSGKDGNLGSSMDIMRVSSSENHHQGHGRVGNFQNAVTIAEPDSDMYYSQYVHNTEGSAHVQKDLIVDNGCGFSGRKDISLSCESGESLRAILSDPVTGALMDDAIILHCGHSFGSAGLQYVLRMKACYTCSQPISEDSVSPNLYPVVSCKVEENVKMVKTAAIMSINLEKRALRSAVHAFRREEELQFYRSSKRRRERFDQDKGAYGDSGLVDPPRSRGVQFPFSVTDRVIIKGNKRTPQRFVGREAIVTTQCLNGWYVVKTLDNAESVKLQYRSLAKVSDDPSSKSISSKMAPNWL